MNAPRSFVDVIFVILCNVMLMILSLQGLEESPPAEDANISRGPKRRSRRGGRASQRNLTQVKIIHSANKSLTEET